MDEEDPALSNRSEEPERNVFVFQRTVCPPTRVCLSLLHSVFPLWPVTRPHRDKDDLTRPCCVNTHGTVY